MENPNCEIINLFWWKWLNLIEYNTSCAIESRWAYFSLLTCKNHPWITHFACSYLSELWLGEQIFSSSTEPRWGLQDEREIPCKMFLRLFLSSDAFPVPQTDALRPLLLLLHHLFIPSVWGSPTCNNDSAALRIDAQFNDRIRRNGSNNKQHAASVQQPLRSSPVVSPVSLQFLFPMLFFLFVAKKYHIHHPPIFITYICMLNVFLFFLLYSCMYYR